MRPAERICRAWAIVLLMVGAAGLASCGPTERSGHSDGEQLRREYSYWQTLDPQQQHQLNELDQWLTDPGNESRGRLERVLDRYNYWLSQLSDSDRQSVVSEKNWSDRLKAIKRIRDREWLETLPKSQRDRYAKATPAERIRLVEFWREEQKERREEWQFVRRNWDDFNNSNIPALFQGEKFRNQMELFVVHLESQLPAEEKMQLLKYRKQPPEEREWYKFIRTVVDLADRHTLLPCATEGHPRTWDELPKPVKEAFEKASPKILTKKDVLPKKLLPQEGRWPDFVVGVVELARSHRIALPEHLLGPTSKNALPPEVGPVVDRLEAQLKKLERTEKGEKAELAVKDLKRLRDAEHKWPDYPRTVMELCKQYRLEVPGWVLPGNPDLWARFRLKPAKKG